MKKHNIAFLLIGLGFGISACETIPYPERVANYENSIKAKFIGKSTDELVLAFGPPSSDFALSDGRKLLQFAKKSSYTAGGDAWTRYESYPVTYRVRDANGNRRTITRFETYPVTEIEPVYTVNQTCKQRFIVNKNNIVEDFSWEGNACFR